MSDSLMSRDERAKFLKDRRKRLRMAEVFEKHRKGQNQFLTTDESIKLAFAPESVIDSEIEWRHRELSAGAREH